MLCGNLPAPFLCGKNARFRHSIQAFLAFAQAFEAVMQALEAFHCFQAL